MKTCSRCKADKDFYMFSKLKSSKDGFSYQCKECDRKCYKDNKDRIAKYRLDNKDKIADVRKKYYEKNKDKIAKYKKEYANINKEKLKQKRIDNKERIKEKMNEWRLKNKDKIKESRKQYRKDNKDKIKKYQEENKEKFDKYQKEWHKSEKGKASSANAIHKRRTITKQGDVTTQQILELKKAKHCYWCNISLKNKTIHIDHYVPLAKGGKHTLSNLVIACSKCNLNKNAKDPIEFANSVGKLM